MVWICSRLLYFPSFWGSISCSRSPEKLPNKFSPVDAIFVGYDPSHKAYRCYIPSLGDVVATNNVKFVKCLFPHRQKIDYTPDSSTINSSDIMFGSTVAANASIPLIYNGSCFAQCGF